MKVHFEVGKRVICIKDHSNLVVKKGQVFELLGIKKGCMHAPIIINIGIKGLGSSCYRCGFNGDNQLIYLNSTLFAPYDDSLSEVTAEELIETLETLLV